MDILPKALNATNISQYEADLADPAAVYVDPNRRDSYLKMYAGRTDKWNELFELA
jgi:ribose transport system substrate-binding protein